MYGAQRTYGFVLAIIATAILVLGFVFKPAEQKHDNKQSSEFTALQGEMDRLREVAQRNSLRNISVRFNAVATQAATHSVAITPLNRPAWIIANDETFIAATDPGAPIPLEFEQTDNRSKLSAAQWSAGLPFVIGHLQLAVPSAKTIALDRITPGAWILIVGRDASSNTHFSPGNYSGPSRTQCGLRLMPSVNTNIALSEDLIGKGVFDLDGNLLAIVVRCDEGPAAIAPEVLRSAATAASNTSDGSYAAYGFRAAELTADWKASLKQTMGVVVTDVWSDWPADEAGIQPADVIVKADNQPITDLASLSAAMQAAVGEHQIEIRRGGVRSRISISESPQSAESAAVDVRHPGGVQLTRVAPDSSAARAGLSAGDYIVSLGRSSATPASTRQLLSPLKVPKAILVLGQRGGRSFARLVTP